MLFIFLTPVLIRHLWQLKASVFLHRCLIHSVLFPKLSWSFFQSTFSTSTLDAECCYSENRLFWLSLMLSVVYSVSLKLNGIYTVYCIFLSILCVTFLYVMLSAHLLSDVVPNVVMLRSAKWHFFATDITRKYLFPE